MHLARLANSPLFRSVSAVTIGATLTAATGALASLMVAFVLGTAPAADAYAAAITIPVFVIGELSGVIGALYVPRFWHLLNAHSEATALRYGSGMGIIAAGAALALAAILFILAEHAVALAFPGLSVGTQAQAVTLFRLASLMIPPAAALSYTAIHLQARRSYLLSSLAYATPNALAAGAAIAVHITRLPATSSGLEGAASIILLARLVGYLLAAAGLVFLIRRQEQRTHLIPRRPPLRWALQDALSAPVLLIAVSNSVSLTIPLFERYYASFLQQGDLAILFYASQLTGPLGGLAARGLAAVSGTDMSDVATVTSSRDQSTLRRMLFRRAGLAALVGAAMVIVANIGVATAAKALFLSGEFTIKSFASFEATFRIYSLAIIGMGVAAVLAKFFYASFRHLIPLLATVPPLAAYLLILWILLPDLTLTAMALAVQVLWFGTVGLMLVGVFFTLTPRQARHPTSFP